MTNREPRKRSHWRGRLAEIAAATLRPLAAAGAAGALAAAMLTASVLAGSEPAGAVPAPHKSMAVARAEATGFAGMHGGHGSGKALGRSRVSRTAKPPALTRAEARLQQRAAEMPVLYPAKAQGTPVARRAHPTVLPVTGAKPTRHLGRPLLQPRLGSG